MNKNLSKKLSNAAGDERLSILAEELDKMLVTHPELGFRCNSMDGKLCFADVGAEDVGAEDDIAAQEDRMNQLVALVLRNNPKEKYLRSVMFMVNKKQHEPVPNVENANVKNAEPPKSAACLLYLFLSKKDGDIWCGDIDQEFRDLCERLSPRFAKLWYWKEVVVCIWPAVKTKVIKYAKIIVHWLAAGGAVEFWHRIAGGR